MTSRPPKRTTRKESRREPICTLLSGRQIGWRYVTIIRQYVGLRLVSERRQERVVKFA